MSNPSDVPPNLAGMRHDYRRGELHRADLCDDPIEQFTCWIAEACQAGIHEPNAMSLATANTDGRTSIRTVLLKHFDARGFVFFTNLDSRKSTDLKSNPNASLLFAWLLLERQAIINGSVELVSAKENETYFHSRPRESQIAAWASPQSSPVQDRQELKLRWSQAQAKFGEGEIPVPPFWGGWRVIPQTIEFWQGGGHRLHDRFRYTRPVGAARRGSATAPGTAGWRIKRLGP